MVKGWCCSQPAIEKIIISDRSILDRLNYRVILQSIHNLEAWPRDALVGDSRIKWSLPARLVRCTSSWFIFSCVQRHSLLSGWIKGQNLSNFRPLRPLLVYIQLVFLLPKQLSPGLRLNSPCLICPTSNVTLVLLYTNFANISPFFFHNSINERSSLCRYNYFLLISEKHLGSFSDNIKEIWCDKILTYLLTYSMELPQIKSLPLKLLCCLFTYC